MEMARRFYGYAYGYAFMCSDMGLCVSYAFMRYLWVMGYGYGLWVMVMGYARYGYAYA